MGVLHAFQLSLSLPKKEAVFQLNRVKTKDFLLYIVFLLLLVSLPNGVGLVRNSVSGGKFAKEFLIILFAYPSSVILLGMATVSLLAATGLAIRKLARRKLVYQLLWKMSVYALTYPVLLISVFNLFGITHWLLNLLALVIFLVIFTGMILAYPKVRQPAVKR